MKWLHLMTRKGLKCIIRSTYNKLPLCVLVFLVSVFQPELLVSYICDPVAVCGNPDHIVGVNAAKERKKNIN